jgi:hypothetical protein
VCSGDGLICEEYGDCGQTFLAINQLTKAELPIWNYRFNAEVALETS